jgi:hydrogenase maturation protein HypF
MGNLETLEHFERTIELYKHLFRIAPATVAYDLHPGYMATRYAIEQCRKYDLQPVPVQHHHAHLAACLADNGWRARQGPVIGVSLDGTGYGEDGHIWGGEWLVGDYSGYRRVAHLEYLPLPGGDAATKNPWRIAFSYLHTLLGQVPEFALPREADRTTVGLLRGQIERRFNCPLTSSMGRLFDAVSALLGVCTHASYEAQAAIELEMRANGQMPNRRVRPADAGSEASVGYLFRIDAGENGYVVRLKELLVALVSDVRAKEPVEDIAWRFHHTVAQMAVQTCERVARDTGIRVVALSGGCFQNRLLLSMTIPRLRAAGFRVLLHRQVPCNDGGVSLGQAVIAHGRRSRYTAKDPLGL